ncbi:WLM domain-containing protein [Gloeopeniophorella convolvens]|nr:WLM domain-containing protein [Gloeopeniophorella convolvens]
MSDVFVLSYEHLKGLPRADQALPFLQKIASRVKPIMRKHGWKLPVLAEFFPDDPHLVGMHINMGQKILLRLRPAWAPDTFYAEEDVVHVMLHELTHNVHGPHDQTFYKFLSGLEEEYYELKRTGYAGEGFFSNGRRLGGGVPQSVPAYVARQRATDAAERRRRAGNVTGTNGPVRLGGGNLASLGLTPRELAVLAADMRAADEKTCASGTVAQREAEKAARDSHHNDAIDLTGEFYVFDDDEIIVIEDDTPSGSRGSSSATSAGHRPHPPKINNDTRPRPPPVNAASRPTDPSSWTCSTCTLVNESHSLQCDACLAVRPPPAPSPAAGWTCRVCGEQGMEHSLWTCRFCGSVKTESTFG